MADNSEFDAESSSGFGAELRQATQNHSLRHLAATSGWGRSTIHEWMTEVRLPGAAQLDDLLDVVDAEPELRTHLHRLRSAEAGQADRLDVHAPTLAPQTPVPAQPARRRRRVLLLAAIAVLVAAGIGIVVGAAIGHRGAPTVSATIVNTGKQGVSKRDGPSKESLRVGAVTEGTQVSVVCLATDGELVSSKVQGGRTSRVWALLDDGSWVSDLYLDTDKSWKPPQDPPPPLRVCGS